MTARAVVFDVDGTLLDVAGSERRVWEAWARRRDLDPRRVLRAARLTRPAQTFAAVAPGHDPGACLSDLHALEDEEALAGACAACPGAAELLEALDPAAWGVLGAGDADRVRDRCERAGLPLPAVAIDASAVARPAPHPEAHLAAARALGRDPRDCLAVEAALPGIAAARAAGMTVCAVNVAPGGLAAAASDRAYARLDGAAGAILEWAAP